MTDKCHFYLANGLAPSTRKVYGSAQCQFLEFCSQDSPSNWNQPLLPANEQTLMCFTILPLKSTCQQSGLDTLTGFPDFDYKWLDLCPLICSLVWINHSCSFADCISMPKYPMKSKDNIKTKISIIHLLLSHCLLKEKVKVKPDCNQLHEANIGSQLCSSASLSFQFSLSFSLLKQVLAHSHGIIIIVK